MREAVTVDFEAEAEPWATYRLDDGSVMKVRVTVNGIIRLEGEFDSGGNPLYIVQSKEVLRIVKAKIRGEPTAPIQQSESKPPKNDPMVG